jgi:hypothetical protein
MIFDKDKYIKLIKVALKRDLPKYTIRKEEINWMIKIQLKYLEKSISHKYLIFRKYKNYRIEFIDDGDVLLDVYSDHKNFYVINYVAEVSRIRINKINNILSY